MPPRSFEAVVERSVQLPIDAALHARPAGALVVKASRFTSEIALSANGRRANAKSILEVLALGVIGGQEVSLTASGADAVEAVAQLAELLQQLI